MNWSKKISDAVTRIPPSGIRKFWEMAMAIDDVISLAIGEPDYDPPAVVLEAMKASIDRREVHYTPNPGILPLRTAIRNWYHTHYGIDYTETEMMATIGASEAIDLALRATVGEGDEVLIPDPAYVAYNAEVQLVGGTPVMVPTYAKDGFRLSIAALEERVTPRTKVLLLGFPSNPTGAILDYDDVTLIAAFAKKHDLIVISDEIYSELTYEDHHVSIASVPGMKERTIVLNGFSKAYAMTGLRIGYLLAPEPVIEACIKIHQYSIVAPATPVQHASIVALEQCDDNIRIMREDYKKRRNFIVKGLQDIGFDIVMPRGAFYAFPNVTMTGLDETEFATQLLLQEHVATIPGIAFGDCGKGHVRLSYASSLATIEEALERIQRFVNHIR